MQMINKHESVYLHNVVTCYKSVRSILLMSTFSLLVTGTSAVFTAIPKNLVLLHGQQATFPCSTNLTNTLEWKIADQQSRPTRIFDGYELHPKYAEYYKINHSVAGQYDLIVTKSVKEIALMYTCVEASVVEITESAELIILESEPTCSVQHSDYDNITMICQVTYGGNWHPVMIWTSNSEDFTQKSTFGISANNSITSVLAIPRSSTVIGQNFNCITKFTSDTYNGRASQKNIPDYVYNCSVPIKGDVRVFEPVCYTLSNTLDYVANTEYITIICQSNYSGNMDPTMEWTDGNKDFTQNATFQIVRNERMTSTLKVFKGTFGEEQTLICIAKNSTNGEIGEVHEHKCSVVISWRIFDTSSPSPVCCVFLIVASVLLTLALVFVLIFYNWEFVRRKVNECISSLHK